MPVMYILNCSQVNMMQQFFFESQQLVKTLRVLSYSMQGQLQYIHGYEHIFQWTYTEGGYKNWSHLSSDF